MPTPGDPAGAPGSAPPPARNGAGASRYRLPGPLSQREGLPVAPGASRIPRPLRAFNGMRDDAPTPPPPVATPEAARLRPAPTPGSRPREPLTIRDLLEEAPPDEVEDGPLAGLRTALRRLRRGGSGEG